MAESDLGPVPAGFDKRTPVGQFALDCEALAGLGFLCEDAAPIAPSDPDFRRAVAEFQEQAGITVDGLIGPQTRAAILEGLNGGELGMTYMAAIAALDTPKRSAHLSAEFFRAVREMAEDFQRQGAKATGEDFLAVWNVESGINPARANGLGADYLGLNQMGEQERASVGFHGTGAEWLALPLLEQLAFVRKWYAAKNVAAMRDAGSLYLVNFLPALAGHAGEPGYVLARRGADAPSLSAPEAEWQAYRKAGISDDKARWYAWNRTLDRAKKGWIEVADMRLAVEAGKQGPYWDEVRDRYYAESGDTPPSGIGGSAVALLFVAGAAALAWWVSQA